MSGYRAYNQGAHHEEEQREYREMVEFDDVHRQQQQQQEHQQYHAQLQHDQGLYQQPYSPAIQQTYYPPMSPQDTSVDEFQYQQPAGRSITDHSPPRQQNSQQQLHHQQQQQYQQDPYQQHQHEGQQQHQHPHHQQSNSGDDYSHNPYEPPAWPLSRPGDRNSASTTQYFTSETPLGGSRSGTPTLVSGSQTPARHPNSSVDWRPSSLMNQSNLSLAGLLPSSGATTVAGGSKTSVDKANITQLHERDDAEIWKGWKRYLFKLTPLLTILNTLLYLTYLGLRVYCVVTAQEAFGAVFAAAWVFIAVEVAVAIPSLMHNTWTMWCLKKRRRARLRLMGNDVPTVDCFVTCCGEDDDLVLDTVRAACAIDYPHDRFRVIVLDDGKSEGLEAMVNELALSYPNVYYMARLKVPGQPHHFKAGNLNHGLDQVHLLPGGAGQFMAALDADMIPEPDWLRALLPHLLLEPKMGLACPPQLFYNTPPSDPLAQSLDFFVHVIEPIKDALGVAWCTGSGYCARREALDEIGNFPLGSLAEDVATSTLMLGRGWKTAYVHEPLQYGTVPEDFGSHLKQRTRWAIGTVDTSFKLKFCLWGDKVRMMTFAQRFSGFLYASLSMYTILLTISLFAIPIILIMGKPLVAYANDEQLRYLVWACFGATMSNRLCEFALFAPAGYHTGQRGSRYQLWMAPYIALCLVRSFMLPKWLGGQTQAFKPTGSLGSAINERDPKLKKNMLRRLWAILINYMALFHFLFVYMTLVAVVLVSYRCFFPGATLREILIGLLTHAFWPPVTFIFMCSSLWTPVAYAIDPPQMPEREELLDRDPKTRIAHPIAKSKKIAFGGQAAWWEIEYTTTTLYTCLVFVASFIWY